MVAVLAAAVRGSMRQRKVLIVLWIANVVAGAVLLGLGGALYMKTGHGCAQHGTALGLLEERLGPSSDAGVVFLGDMSSRYLTKPISTEFVSGEERAHTVFRYTCGRSMIELWFSKPNHQEQSNTDAILYAARTVSHDHNGTQESRWWALNAEYFADYAEALGAKLMLDY